MPIDWQRLKDQLTVDEAKRNKPYKCSAGKTTIGVGRNLDDKGLSSAEIDVLLENDMADAVADCRAIFKNFDDIDETRSNALANMAFNLGKTRFLAFKKMIAAVDARNWPEAAKQAKESAWYRQVGNRAARICVALESGNA